VQRDQADFERSEHLDACVVVRDAQRLSQSLAAAGATIAVRDAGEIAQAVRRMLSDPVERAARAAAAAGIAADNRAVLDAVLQRIAPWLDRLAAHAAGA